MSTIKDIIKEAVIEFHQNKMESSIDADLSVLEIDDIDIQDIIIDEVDTPF